MFDHPQAAAIPLSAPPTGVQRCYDYAWDVVKGNVLACKKVQKAAWRFLNDLKRQADDDYPYRFDEEKAERPITFIESFLAPTKGEWERMELMPWQCFALCNVFGWVRKENGLRRFREALIYVGNGNGKSTLMSGLAAYLASKDGERGAQVGLFAYTKDEARIVFDECCEQLKASPQLVRPGRFRVLRDRVCYDPTSSVIRPFASVVEGREGMNLHGAIFDEIHEFRNFRLINVVKRKMIKRRQPIFFYLTTAGYVDDGPLDQYYILFSDAMEEGKLRPEVADRLFALIYELDDDDRVDDESCWIKANPSLGVLLDPQELHAAWETAKRIPPDRADFICKTLNLKVNADEASYVDFSVLKKNNGVIQPEELEGHVGYVGFDLSTREDFTAAAVVVPLDDGREFVMHHSWVPRKKLATYPEGADFMSWAMMGLLSIVDNDYIEQDRVAAWILEQAKRYDILGVGYDPANARWLVMELEGKGLPCEVVRQGPITLNDPMKDLKEMLLSGKIVSNNDPMLRWYTDNVRLSREARHTDKANWMPTKRKRSLKIDGFMAWLFAHTLAMRKAAPPLDDERFEIISLDLS